jgi:hypothetical protein
MLADRRIVRLPEDHPPVLVVVVDTEEEFDWSKGFDRNATTVSALRRIGRFQEVCDECGIRPTYVVDYPVASRPEGIAALRDFHDTGRAVVGAHLHPWVNPPLEERICASNSFPGNLERDLEARKIRALSEAIEAGFGTRPTVYRAGRYGFGANTASILGEEGFLVDSSIPADVDLRPAGGPDFSEFGPDPFWFGRDGALLEIPVTGAYVGPLARHFRVLRGLARSRSLRPLRLMGILARLRLMQRLRLSPEAMGTGEHRRLIDALLLRGTRVFSFNLHSTTLEPGCTGYVRSEADLDTFLDTCRATFRFFKEELGGLAMTPLEARARLEESAR